MFSVCRAAKFAQADLILVRTLTLSAFNAAISRLILRVAAPVAEGALDTVDKESLAGRWWIWWGRTEKECNYLI